MKNFLSPQVFHQKYPGNQQIYRIMKLTASSLMLCSCLAFAGNAHSQSAKVSVSYSQVQLKEVLDGIENQTDYLFVSNTNVDLSKRVSVHATDAPVSEILNTVLKNTGLTYVQEGVNIILSQADAPTPAVRQASTKRTIKGRIVDTNGEAVIGANVKEKGATNGAISDLDGKFTLSVPTGATLVISYIGYKPQEIKVDSRNDYAITLEEDSETLDEVVVVGYGTVKKKDLTGAVGAVKGETLAERKSTQLSEALQGAVAGVTVTRDNGEPGATASIKVRGVTTIGDTTPLVIVDGVPGDINQVNPNDVENISVLKDAASASIYGSRAAAGVILITTKRAKENDLRLNYNFEYGWQIPTRQPEYVGVQRYLEMSNELRYNDNPSGGWYQAYSEDQVNNWMKYNATDPDNYPDTDWRELMMRDSAPRQTHSVSISGGSKVVRTQASFTYDKVNGLIPNRYYERYMFRVNNDITINKWVGATLDVNFKRSKSHKPATGRLFEDMRMYPPVYAAVWHDGRIAEGKTGGNPYGRMIAGGTRDEWYNRLAGKASLDLTPLKGLKVSAVIAPVYNFDKIKNFKKAVPWTLANDPNTIGGYLEEHASTKLTENRNDSWNVTIQGIINYDKSFGKHSLNLMGGYETYKEFSEGLEASRDQYELTNFPYLDLGPLSMRDNSGNAIEVAYRSWFGRAMYNYADRYLLQANVRYDGSSRFYKDNRWGAFPSFSAGWVVSEEKFMQDAHIDWLSFLKLRASYGTLGNERIYQPNTTSQNYYPWQSAIAFSNVLFYQNGVPVSQLSAAQQIYAIRNITWEKTRSFDFGFDAQFLRNRLRLTFDYYKKKTSDMLLALEIPDYVGFDNPQKNTGDMKTHGYELELAWNDQIGDFSYGVSLNFSDFVSKMGNLGGTEFLGDQVKMEGSEFNEWYGYVSEGIYQTQEEVDNSARLNDNVKVGDIRYKDISGPDGVPDGIISSEYDRTLLGGSLPRYMFGGRINAAYKGFDLSLAFQGVGKQWSRMGNIMMQPLRWNFGNMPAIIDGHYWSEKNTPEQNLEAKYPRLTYANADASYNNMSDFYLFNGRYVRLKNVTIGYTLPQAWLKAAHINNVRLYVSGNDLFSISKFPKGWDPEMGSSNYPITTSLLFGVSVNF